MKRHGFRKDGSGNEIRGKSSRPFRSGRGKFPLRIRWFLGAFLVAALPQTGSSGDGAPGKDLTEMSLEQLLNIRVDSATKSKSLGVRQAPGIVRVLTRADIERYGFQKLSEVLANVPGIQLQQYRGGHQSVWVRGIPTRYNNKILWLLDGVPLRDSYYGHNNVDEVVPLELIERVEIINGPGGVLYGSNAFTGVVSITTRSLGKSARLGGGGYGLRSASAEYDAGPVSVFADYEASRGFHPLLNSDGQAWDHPQNRDQRFAFVKLDQADLQATFAYIRQHYADPYREGTTDRFWTRTPIFGAVRYQKQLGGRVLFSAQGFYEDYPVQKYDKAYSSAGALRKISGQEMGTALYGADLQTSIQAGRHSLILGASFLGDKSNAMAYWQSYPTLSRTPGLIVPRVVRAATGVFLQDVWSWSESFDLTVGIRYDELSEFRDPFSYRIGLTGHRGKLYGKLLYGTAYRMPSFREYLNVKSYNLSLRPEFLKTLEAQIGVALSRSDFNLTFYDNNYTDVIRDFYVNAIRTPAGVRTVEDEYAINTKRSRTRGLEGFFRYYPTKRSSLLAGTGYILRAREELGTVSESLVVPAPLNPAEVDTPFLSNWTGSLLVSYQVTNNGSSIGLNWIAASRRIVPPGYQEGVPLPNRRPENADGYSTLDLISNLRLGAHLELRLKVTNLLDRRIYSPPFDNPSGYDSQWAGRTFRIDLIYR